MTKKNILITGASGLIGSRLTELLLQNGYQVSHLGRKKKTGMVRSFVWDVETSTIDTAAFEGIDTIIHLAGAGIADKPWSESRKNELLVSRTNSTKLLLTSLSETKHTVKNFISASAIGYYGFGFGDKSFTEEDGPGSDFLAQLTAQWEDEINKASAVGLRTAKVRIGIVLSDKGGALKSIMKPIMYYAGAPLGSGKQLLSWIHIDDLCNIFIHLVENEQLIGSFNGTGPYAVSNETLTRAIAYTLRKPLLLPNVPAFVLKLLLGEMADLVLKGSNVSSGKIQQTGFTFRYPTLQSALENLIGSRHSSN